MVYLFTDCGWDNLFRVKEPAYGDFLLDFFMTVTFDPIKAYDDRTAFSFRLCGISRECSMIKIAIRVGIYTKAQTRSIHFRKFLSTCITSSPRDYSESDH